MTAPPVEITDEAKALAEEHGIALDGVKGTGSGGKIVKKDVVKLVPKDEKAPAEKKAPTSYRCPKCGKTSDEPGFCASSAGGFPHAATEMVPTQ